MSDDDGFVPGGRPTGAIAIPPELPAELAPKGTKVCTGVKHRELRAWAGVGNLGVCSKGHRFQLHPETFARRKAAQKPKRGPKPSVWEFTEGDAPAVGLLPISPMEAWDADSECPHGLLDFEACEPCGRPQATMFPVYPGVRRIALLERRHIAHLQPARLIARGGES